ncbi:MULTISPECIES: lysine N(6)-hydroxylase/L-ornithine N(5)-oxygenase family protein [Dickeya]|uniref:L-ornithine 5-monooxygenase n=1 Tax=Dickeya aquatica TaxID=1401087 RepID=A0A375A796_9GAMM|nr:MULTISPECIES: SidA/IucD/PvdA family monooxygenase [Dickeya]SLM61880.1 L-ornithine 5-monooxygenase [Dickeya aquatica]
MLSNIYDIIGVGFGPANLALSICIDENNEKLKYPASPLKSLFFEKNESFSWHPGMLINDATMQISYLKDLVTLRNPASPFSFLNYLHQKNRLEDFINLKSFYPTRVEYFDYLNWAAQQQQDCVRYAHRVDDIKPRRLSDGSTIVEVWVTDLSNGTQHRFLTKNLAVATGIVPKMPEIHQVSASVIHSSQFLPTIQNIPSSDTKKFLVVGGGQSAAEIVNHLYDRFDNATVTSVFSTFGFKPADDSHFVNRIFDAESVDMFFSASVSLKSKIMDTHADTNYSVVDGDLIAEIYKKVYQEKVNNQKRIQLRQLTRLSSVKHVGSKPIATLHNLKTDEIYTEEFDYIIMATGYRVPDITELFPSASELIALAEDNSITLDRNYSVSINRPLAGKIYLPGMSEAHHGLSATLLSLLPIRANEIVRDVTNTLSVKAASVSAEVVNAN